MKILFISDVYFPRVNGVSTSIETYHRNLRLLGHVVHVIAPDYAMPSSDETDIMRAPSSRVPFDPEDRLMSFKWVMSQQTKIRSENYDLIHIQTPFVAHYLGVKLSRMLGIPCVETYHTFFEEYLHHYVPLIPKKVTRFIAKRFSRHQGNSLGGMVVPSRPMLRVLKGYGITTPMEVIPTGIEPASFVLGDRAAFRARHGIPQDQPVMLFVGRVAHEKNIGFLLDVVDRIRHEITNILFVIAGEGPALRSLQQQVKDLRVSENVMFVGYLDRHKDLNDCYRAADVFVFSSRTETQGLVLLEAMAQGVPVVSTAELGTCDVLREGLGVWIAQEDLTDFSGKVVKMLDDESARKALSDSGRDYAAEWSAHKQAKRMLSFYDGILKLSSEHTHILTEHHPGYQGDS